MDCLRWAHEAHDPSQRQILHDTATQWMAIAHKIENAAPLIDDEDRFLARLKRILD